MSYSFGAHAVEVEVDEETGLVRVVDFVAATDCGNLVNPALAESQVEGGAAQGIGYGLMEDLICEEGQVLNPHFATYRVPTATEMPPMPLAVGGDRRPARPVRRQGARRDGARADGGGDRQRRVRTRPARGCTASRSPRSASWRDRRPKHVEVS